IALSSKADAECIVPESRTEVTTEGGLDVRAEQRRLARIVLEVRARGAEVRLLIDPDLAQIEVAARAGTEFVELHTGSYALATGAQKRRELARLHRAALFAHEHGLRVNAGHG